jgi:hypothetical protein
LTRPFNPVEAANDLWCIDFKGWFRTRDGRRCDPLTISGAHSRLLIECRIVPPDTLGVWPVSEAAFREYGLPRAIRSDNGSPFASTGPAGLTRLAVHWIKLGIRLERIDPGRPEQNGRHERMHKTLKQETSRPPAGNPAEQQARFDQFRYDFNMNRPHEALGQETPASHYQPSTRAYPERVMEPWYDADHQVRRVRTTGEIKWQGAYVFISEALAGEPVGITELETGDNLIRFADVDLGILNRATQRLHPYTTPHPGQRNTKPAKSVNDATGS